MARTLHAMMRRGRNQADQHVLVRGGCDQGERLMPTVGRVFFERAVSNLGPLELEAAQLEEAGWLDTVNSMVLVPNKFTYASGQDLASTISWSLRAGRHL